MFEALSYTFMQHALLGGIFISLCCSLLGPFLVLRRLSLLGDGLAHFAFGGIAFGILFGVHPVIAAVFSALLGVGIITFLLKRNVYGDAAIALLLSFGVGLGIVMIGLARGFTVNLFSYLIGSILALSVLDLWIMGIAALLVLVFVVIFYKDLMFMTFNEELARLHRKHITLLNVLFMVLTALTVVVSIRAVGILLVTALLVIPSLIALSLSRSFKSTLWYSVIISEVFVIGGIFVSYVFDIPPSGTIVLLLFFCYVIVQIVRSVMRK